MKFLPLYMLFSFYKYQGTGNDFVMIDNRAKTFPKENSVKIAAICNRHFGVGADGLILLENDAETDFRMVYFNANGSEGSLCGNGGRCMVAFAKKLKIIESNTSFMAIDGIHYAHIENDFVALQIADVDTIDVYKKHLCIDTGSPHHIQLVENIAEYPVFSEGKKIRNTMYGKAGSNINFVQQLDTNTFKVRTYERGVEDETLACGTGVTAVAIGMHKIGKTKNNSIHVEVEGGTLEVSFYEEHGVYKNIYLKGTATFVFEGSIEV
ncbi:MAG: diaminopimelate epimerase [Polaribacter sp.]